MARYLLIEVDDDRRATKLVEQFVALDQAGKGVRAIGLYGKPTQFCGCPPELPKPGTPRTPPKTLRGRKMGWYVHDKCRKPKPGYQSPTNLLFPDDKGKHYETIWLNTAEGREHLAAHGIFPPAPKVNLPHSTGRESEEGS